MRVGIIGTGLQGGRRAEALRKFEDDLLVAVTARHVEDFKAFADRFRCEACETWKEIVARRDVDAVIVCTTPDSHAEISMEALKQGKHVLCEKPLTRTLEEAEHLLAAARHSGRKLKCGFNHRHHPAIVAARGLNEEGRLGRPLFARARYGICGRAGYEREWRANPKVVGGGQLMEQGIHCVDLFRWFLGNLVEVTAFTETRYWPMKPLEDNAFVLFRSGDGVVASLHSSLTQWQNLFCFEVFGDRGYAIVEGLGGAYGTERLITGRADFGKPFAHEVTEFRAGDVSWAEEWKEFRASIAENREPIGNGQDGLEAMRLVCAAYEASKKGCVMRLEPASS